MTNEEKNIKICEALGWRRIKPDMVGPLCWEKANEPHTLGFTAYWQHELPNYFGDLNACHEMEKRLSWIQGNEYNENLCDILPPDQHIYHATAAQRAEAFGLTLGLWKKEDLHA